MASTSNGLSLGFIVDTLNPIVQSADASLKARLASTSSTPNPTDPVAMQAEMFTFNMVVEIESTVLKNWADTTSKVANKMN